jgi:hypothetical protein
VSPRKSAAARAASDASVAAATSAVGSARATSPAKLGPDTTPTGAGQRGAMSRCASAASSPPDPAWTKPFDSHMSGARTPAPASAPAIASSAFAGVATSTTSARAARAGSWSIARSPGSATPGR